METAIQNNPRSNTPRQCSGSYRPVPDNRVNMDGQTARLDTAVCSKCDQQIPVWLQAQWFLQAHSEPDNAARRATIR